VKASLTALSTAMARVPPASASVRAAQQRANAALSQLQALAARWPADSPDDYRDNLSGDVMALDAALRTGTAESLAATLQAVAEDLEIKLEHCNLSGGKLGGSVVVRVRTVAGAQEAASWQVFYMPRVFEAATNASPDLFPQLSSPTVETLVPGRYVMWVRDPATARLGERTHGGIDHVIRSASGHDFFGTHARVVRERVTQTPRVQSRVSRDVLGSRIRQLAQRGGRRTEQIRVVAQVRRAGCALRRIRHDVTNRRPCELERLARTGRGVRWRHADGLHPRAAAACAGRCSASANAATSCASRAAAPGSTR